MLIAPDIAARGIDFAGLSHVFNYDMPMEPEAYVHRIGRTGRAGRDGTAISFCCIDEIKQLEQVEKLIGKRLPVKQSEWPMLVTTPTDPKEKEAARQLAKAARLAKLGRTAEMPKKITMSGTAAPERKAGKAVKASAPQAKAAKKPAEPERKPRFGPGSEDRSVKAALPKGGQAIVIGKNGKVQSAVKTAAPQAKAPKAAPQAKAASHKGGKSGLGKPVQRVNRARGRNGEH